MIQTDTIYKKIDAKFEKLELKKIRKLISLIRKYLCPRNTSLTPCYIHKLKEIKKNSFLHQLPGYI